MNFRTHSFRKPGELLLDLTPLIDVVFLLLIFFLITTTFVRRYETVVTINLPEGQGEVMLRESQNLTIFIDREGLFTLHGPLANDSDAVDYDNLTTELEAIYANNPALGVFIRADRDVDYGAFMDVLLLAKEIGFGQVLPVIRQPSLNQPTPDNEGEGPIDSQD